MAKKIDVQQGPYIGQKMHSPHEVAELLLALAATASGHGNYAVAAVVLNKKNQKIVSVGMNSVIQPFHHHRTDYNESYTDAHAEINSLHDFLKKRMVARGDMKPKKWEKAYNIKNYELWSLIVPCRMCEGGAHSTGIDTYYLGGDDVIKPPQEVFAPEKADSISRKIRLADGVLEGAFEGVRFDVRPYAARAAGLFDATKDDVRALKEVRETKQFPPLIDIAAYLASGNDIERRMGEAVLRCIKDRVRDWEDVFGHKVSGPADDYVWDVLEKRAERSVSNGNDRNAALVIDQFGTVWFSVGDHTMQEQNPLRRPLMRAYKRLEDIYADTPEGFLTREGKKVVDIFPVREHLMRPGQFTVVCYREPTIWEFARASSLYAKDIVYLHKDPVSGVQTTGELEQMGDFYLKARGMGNNVLKWAGDLRKEKPEPGASQSHEAPAQWTQAEGRRAEREKTRNGKFR